MCFLLPALLSCAGKYGTLQMDGGVGQEFANGVMKPNYTYYYFGRADAPTAIMGLDNRFVLGDADLWYPISPQSSDNLRGLVQTMYDALRMQISIPPDLRGFRIMDQDGRYVGDWYSLIGVTTTIISTGNKVVVYPPQL